MDMEDFSRCFSVPPLPDASSAPDRSSQFESVVDQLSYHCWRHYEKRGGARHHSLYLGSLGPCAFVRYKLAGSLGRSGEREQRQRILHDALRAANEVLGSNPAWRGMTVTLLEGERVGALALSAAINHALRAAAGRDARAPELSRAKGELLDIGNRIARALPRSECEVLYGRAGYLHAIAFVRSETSDGEFGTELVRDISKRILEEGERFANESAADLPLLWEWYGEAYLGAIHGVAGILFTLLCFPEEVSSIEGAMTKIKSTITKLGGLCFSSGNLKSSLGWERDELVHLCHGAPGHILLLAKAYEVLDEKNYLESAERIGAGVICRRGLLKKGVGLCHGISGSAYCFLTLYRGRRLFEERSGDLSTAKSDEWLRWAHHFANFAVDNVEDLFGVPDRPCSLYEGAAGLIMLLHDLKCPGKSCFPCFEPRVHL